MRIDVLSLFPEMFRDVFNHSIIKRAQEQESVSIYCHDFRQFSVNKHQKVDDTPYGGGAGMLLSIQPIYDALEFYKNETNFREETGEIIMLTPQGEPFSQKIAQELSQKKQLIFLCGHYEGFDERIREHLVTRELSLGDFVLTGGELAAMTMIDATVRLLPEVIQKASHEGDSFSEGLLEYPQYTKPRTFNGWDVPEVLLSGNHQKIAQWRKQQSIERTIKRRPDLIQKRDEQTHEK